MLYLIRVLHQTTTKDKEKKHSVKLYLIRVLHQTTTLYKSDQFSVSCILFVFYIKPQHKAGTTEAQFVVSYSCSTSNHNLVLRCFLVLRLYLIRVLHQTTTKGSPRCPLYCCILFVFYIKPQRIRDLVTIWVVVSYSCSTSNHNARLGVVPTE